MAHGFDPARTHPLTHDAGKAAFERLEGRLLLDSAPIFATPLAANYVITPGGGGLTVGVDGFDADGDALTITAKSDNGKLKIRQPKGNCYARLHFLASDGASAFFGDGDIVVQLFEGRAPEATQRFITLATKHIEADGTISDAGDPFYTDVPVHRVIDEFMIQTGDAANGDGTGDSPLPDFGDPDGKDMDPLLSYAGRGALALAHGQTLDSNNSQFFITDGPTTWLNQQHIIFGQVISGWDVLEALSRVPAGGNGAVFAPPVLESVEIFESSQDATFTFTATAGFEGQAHVTVKLRDRSGKTATQVITITDYQDAAQQPTVPYTQGIEHTVMPGEQFTFRPTIGDGPDNEVEDVSVLVYDDAYGADVTISPDTHDVDISIPSDFEPAKFDVRVIARYPGVEYDNKLPPSWVFKVSVVDEEPLVSLPSSEVTVLAGQQSSFTVTVTDDHDSDFQVWAETDDPALAGAVSVDPDTLEVTVDVPSDIRRSEFMVSIKAQEAGYLPWGPGVATFWVDTAGEAPVVDAPNSVIATPGEELRFTPSITDADGPRELEVSVQVGLPDVQVTIDPVTYEVTLITPDDLIGVFWLSVSAVESGYDDRAPVSDIVYVFNQQPHDPLGQGHLGTDPSGIASGTFRLGDLLYVANGSGGLEIWDVGSAVDPELLGSYPSSYASWAVQVDPNALVDDSPATVAYLADLYGGVLVLDVTDPAQIELIDTLTRTDQSLQSLPAVDVHVDGDFLYVAHYSGGMTIYDIAEADSIFQEAVVRQITEQYYVQACVACTVHDGYSYLVDSNGYLFIHDVIDPTSPQFVTGLGTGAYARDVEIADGRAYVVGLSTGLLIADVQDPTQPALLGYYPVGVDSWPNLAVSGNLAAVTTPGGILFLDVSDPTQIMPSYEFIGPGQGGTPSFSGTQIALPIAGIGVSLLDAELPMNTQYVQKKRVFRLPDGRTATVKISGGGTARARPAADGLSFEHFEVLDSTSRTAVTITTSGGDLAIGDVDIYGPLGKFVGRTTDLLGDFTAEGIVAALQLDDVADAHLIAFNTGGSPVGPRDKVTITFDRVADTSIQTHGVPINSLTVTEWLDTGGQADTVAAPWIAKLTAKGLKGNPKKGIDPLAGDFAAGLALDGAGVAPGKPVLGSASIAGEIACLWDIDGTSGVGAIKAGSTGETWTLDAEGPVEVIDTKGDLEGSIAAKYFGKISTKGDLAAGIGAIGVDGPKRTSIGSLTAGSVRDVSLNVPGGIGSITVVEWLDTGGDADKIEADWIGKLTTKGRRANPSKGIDALAGHFQAGLDLACLDPQRPDTALGSAWIAGDLGGATWTLHGGAGAVRVVGDVDGWTAEATSVKSLTAGHIGTAHVTVTDAIGAVKACQWDGGKLEADSVKSLNITGRRANTKKGISALPGHFGADLALRGLNVAAGKTALGSAKIAGDLLGCDWLVEAAMGKLTVLGTALGCTVRSDGSMLGLTLGASDGSDFLAGIADNGKRHADAPGDFQDPDAAIKSIQIKGWKIPKGEQPPRFVTDSNFSAGEIGAVSVLNPAGGDPYGLHVSMSNGLENVKQVRYKDTLSGEAGTWKPGKPFLIVGSSMEVNGID